MSDNSETSEYIKYLVKKDGVISSFYGNMTFSVGEIIVDPKPFLPEVQCDNGIFFTKKTIANKWFISDNEAIFYVDFPEGAQVVDYGTKFKTDRIILLREFTPEEYENQDMETVSHYGGALQHIARQTPKICLVAVLQDWWALQFVKEQTPEICLAAVRQDERALQFVKEQTLEICLAAVAQDGRALEFVKDQTPEICLAGVKQIGWALEYVREQTPEICRTAILYDARTLQFVKEQTPELCLLAVSRNKAAARHIKCPFFRPRVQSHGILNKLFSK